MRFRHIALFIPLLAASTNVVGADVDFERQVRPILTRHCLRCHGDKADEGGLRLSTKRHAFTPADSEESVISPGKANTSLLIKRVTGSELGDRMPADASALSDAELKILRDWINEGANWPDGIDGRHWAYKRPARPAPPSVSIPDHGNTIDRFVNARMADAKMEPSGRANKARLLRRASLTLTGLPPSIEELDVFLSEKSSHAYERAIDRLIASPRYGERWAQQWLDLARYADSNGFQADQLREIWAYRDWVINALNDDMPFDQFTVEQLAGDMLPNATADQRIATGFHRTVPTNVEAGVHPEENRHNQVFDRVNTTGTVFLGATIECAQCHDHKYDPFSQEDYYRLFAFFNNTPLEVKLNAGVQWELDGPKMDLPLPPAKQEQLDGVRARIASRKAELDSVVGTSESRAKQRRQWERNVREALQRGINWNTLKPTRFTSTGGETFERLSDDSLLAGGKIPQGSTKYTIEFNQPIKSATAIRLDALLHPSLPGTGPGRGDEVRNNFVLQEVKVSIRRGKNLEPIKLVSARADYSQPNWAVEGLIDGNLKSGWAIAGEFSKPHWATLTFKKPLSINVSGKASATGGTVEQASDSADPEQPGANANPLTETLVVELIQNFGRGRTLGRVKLSTFSGDPSVTGIDEELAAAIRKTNRQRSKSERKLVTEFYESANPVAAKLKLELAELEKQLKAIRPPTTLVMVEMEKQRKTHILNRGNYLEPDKPVKPGTPSILHSFDTKRFSPNRLGLAQWLVSKDNPLVARVVVNRWWTEIFGRGLVETPEDFGTQSEPPTHPLLLDWLATEFMSSGWSMKHMHKMMVMSAAFQRSSTISSEALALDPKNKWYGRGPRYRLAAETIRDNALKIAGVLETKMGGAPIMPYQPNNIWRAVGRNAPKWKTARNTDRFRRGIYVVWRRAAPYPSFVNFDAPDRAACVVNRPRTNTPNQALTLLNDPAYLELAFGLARRMQIAGDTFEERIEHGFRRCVARKPTNEELQIVTRLYRGELARLKSDPELADKLFKTVVEYEVPANANRIELAAWFAVANALLNLDETITNG